MIFKPEFFFNLKHYAHGAVFSKDAPVWSAIANLTFYLGSMLAQPRTDPYRTGSDLQARYPHVVFDHPDQVRIAEGVKIGPFVHISGRAYIEEGVEIRSHVLLRSAVLIGRGAVIGMGTEVKNSIFFPGARASHKNSVLDSILGHHVTVGGHLVTPNRTRSGKDVRIRTVQGPLVETGLRKLGIIAGDGSFFGCRVHFNPGDNFLPNTRLI